MSLTLRQAAWEVLTLNAATSQLTTREQASNQLSNIGLVSALLLTMVTIAPADNVGSMLPLDSSLVSDIFTGVSFVCAANFFMSTLSCALLMIFCSMLGTDELFVQYVERLGYMFKVSLGTFFAGLLCYILLMMFQLLSFLAVSAAVPSP